MIDPKAALGITMGSIREHRPGLYRVKFFFKGKPLYVYKDRHGDRLETRAQAARTLSHIEDQIRNRIFDPAEWCSDRPFLFESACRLWMDLKEISEPETRERTARNHLLPYWTGKDIREIRGIHVQEFLKALHDKSLSDKTCKNILGELAACLRFHADSIPKMPVFPTVTVQERPIIWLTEDQQENIFQAIPEAHRPIFDFMRVTGCRPNEARGLQRKNVFRDQGYLVIATVLDHHGNLKDRTKTKKVRALPITPRIKDALQGRELGLSPYIFTFRGAPYKKRTLERIWSTACAKAGISINLYNGLKHSFGCQRLNQGFTLDEIKAVMGHTDKRTTERYAKFITQSLADVIDGRGTNGVQDGKKGNDSREK